MGLAGYARAKCERPKPVFCHLLALPQSKIQWTNAPTHTPAHCGRTSKWRVTPRLLEPLDRHGWRTGGGAAAAGAEGQAAHGRPGQQRPIRPLAASLASSCPISSPWPAAAGSGSGVMSRPSGRRPSSCDQCGSTAATEPRRGRPQARWSTAMDGELGALGRAARAPGRSAGCRGAQRRGTYWHTT
eukprot:scaffold27154_cov31-Phaeocystis_antarctica.AAC.2